MGKKRKVPGINGSSSADIAFMLLLFFLLTTSMDTDMGLARRLPPPPDKQQKKQEVDVKKRNMLVVLISSTNHVLCGGEYVDIKQVKAKAKEFIANVNNDPNLPEKEEAVVPFFGKMMISKAHVISLQNDRGTRYQAYIDVQNELAAAYNELRDELAKQKWGKTFAELNEEQQEAIQMIYPQKISEAEPKNYGGEKKTEAK
ncbi:biopolymer transporter ExbD [Tannerella sp. oral taxon 808]|nr:biopolymer transporter ExbD [Tannerella sp. oral taxon 808]